MLSVDSPARPPESVGREPDADDVTSVRAALRHPRRLRVEVLAGLVVALALILEAISFAIIAGVDPRVGLFASFTMAVSIASLGGRPAMISAATGAVALVIAPVMRDHGFEYLVATVLLAGVLQVLLGVAGVARLMRFIPRSVMVGFVNSLAILIFLAQVPHLTGVPWLVYPLVAVGIDSKAPRRIIQRPAARKPDRRQQKLKSSISVPTISRAIGKWTRTTWRFGLTSSRMRGTSLRL